MKPELIPYDSALLRVHAVGEVPAQYASSVLARFEEAHYGLQVINSLRLIGLGQYTVPDEDDLVEQSERIRNSIFRRDTGRNTGKADLGSLFASYFSDYHAPVDSPQIWRDAKPLLLNAVVLQSPGWWEFLGSLSPLKALMDYLNDRHSRRKDIAYKNRLEEEKLTIENKLLQLRLISETIDVAKKAGIPDVQITGLIRDHAVIPLLKIESLQDKGLIGYAEISHPTTVVSSESVDG